MLGFLTTKRERKALPSWSIWLEAGKQTNTTSKLGMSHKRKRTEVWHWLCALTLAAIHFFPYQDSSFSIAILEGAILLGTPPPSSFLLCSIFGYFFQALNLEHIYLLVPGLCTSFSVSLQLHPQESDHTFFRILLNFICASFGTHSRVELVL